MDVLGQFNEIWVVDTEFRRLPGGLPEPVCCVCAKELKTGREVRVWTEHGAPQPFSTGPENLFVAHYSSAEWVSFLSLGWVPPVNVIDTYVEGRVLTNGMPGRKDATDKSEGRRRRCGLTHLAAMYGINAISDAMKDAGRELAMKGAPWSDDEQAALMTYCMTDVETCSEVFMAMLPEITAPAHGLAQAMIRGRYMRACAAMELTGIPVDVDLIRRFKANWQIDAAAADRAGRPRSVRLLRGRQVQQGDAGAADRPARHHRLAEDAHRAALDRAHPVPGYGGSLPGAGGAEGAVLDPAEHEGVQPRCWA